MGCKQKLKTTEARAKSWLRNEGVINKFLEIKDLVSFRKLNVKLTAHGKEAYGIDTQWFYEEQGGLKALPNKDAFRRADRENGIFYQKSSTKSKEKLNKEIEDKLKTFLTSYGINLRFVDSLRDRGFDAVAMADTANKLITVAKDEADASTLPEEVAHMAVELLGEDNPLVRRLMDSIENTDTYDKTYEEYKADPLYMENGHPNIQKIKKEAVGKAIANQILRKEAETSLSRTVKLLWQRVMKLFKKVDPKSFNKEVDNLSGILAKEILNNTLDGSTDNLSGNIFLQKTNEKKDKAVKRAENSIITLKVRQKNLERKRKDPLVAEHRDTIKQIEQSIINNEAVAGVGYYVDHASIDTSRILGAIEDYRDGDSSMQINPSTIQDMGDFIDTHEETVIDIIKFFANDPEFMAKGAGVLEAARELRASISTVREFYDYVKKEKTIEIISERVHKGSKYTGEELYEKTSVDTSWFRKNLLSLKHAEDEALRISYDILEKSQNEVDRFTLDVGRDLTNAQIALEKKGFKDFGKFYEKYSDGTKTGNLLSRVNNGQFRKDLEGVKVSIAKELGFEEYSEIDKNELNPEQVGKFKSKWNKFYKESVDQNGQPNHKYVNEVFKSLSKEELDYYNKLKAIKEEAMEKLPSNFKNAAGIYKMPQIRKSALDRLKSKEQGLFKNFKEIIKESVNVQLDDTEYGDQSALVNPITGKVHDLIPIHFNQELQNMNNLSDDISSMYIAYAQMAENFAQKSKVAPELSLIKNALGERTYEKGSKTKKPVETNTYQLLSIFMDTHLYGKKAEKHDVKWRGEVITNKDGNPVTWEKLADTLNSYVRRNNLVFNAFTHVANYTMGSVFSKIEDAAGVYTTQESKIWAEGELDKNLPGIVAQLGKRIKTNKVAALYEYNNVSKGTLDHFKNLNMKTGTSRVLMNDGLYSTYAIGDYRVKGKIMLAMYDNFRVVNGEFMKRNEVYKLYKEDKAKAKQIWKEAKSKSLYNAYDIIDGKVTVKPEFKEFVNNKLEDRLKNSVNQVTDQVDGMLSPLDRSALHRNAIGRLVLTHRSWLLTGVENRWKKGSYNYSTEEYEEGYHRTFSRQLFKSIVDNKGNFIAAIKNWEQLTPLEQSNMKKGWADIMAIALIAMLSASIQKLADDDDDESTQMLAYMFTRFELESRAFSNPFEVLSLLKSPAAGINQVESIMSGFGMLIDWDEEGVWGPNQEVRSGAFQDYSKFQRLLIKRSFAKNFFELGSSKDKNRYLRNQVL